MIRVLAVSGMDPSYGERFADYVNQKEKTPFMVMSLSSAEKPRQYGEEHVIEILLADEDVKGLVKDVKVRRIMALCQGELMEEKEEFPTIYKYQLGDCVVREVMARYCSQPTESALVLPGSRVVVTGIYSPVNRRLKSSLALTMRQQMARQEVVLYMNLEEYSGFSRLVCGDYRVDLSDVLYPCRQGTHNWVRLKSMVYNWRSVDYIPPVRYGEDLSQVTPEEVAMLIDHIACENEYDKVVVDVGRIGRGVLSVLFACDVVYMPAREDCVSATKIEELEEYLEAADGGSVRERIQKLKLPRTGSVIRREGYLGQLSFGELEDFVRQLLTKREGLSSPLLIEELIAQPAPVTRHARKF